MIYVWIDALINYTSALTYARPGEDLTERYWPARWQLLAKDILKFHAVIWPAMLMSAGYEVPQQLLIHGYLTVRDAKMSKAVGNVLDPFRVIERYGLDALRYYLFRDVRFGGDGDVSYERVHDRFNLELANDLGNLAVALGRDGRALPRRRRARRDASTPAIREVLERSGVELRRARRPVRADRGARGRAGTASARSTASSRSARRGSSPRTRRVAPSSTTCCTRCRTALRVIAVMVAAFIPRRVASDPAPPSAHPATPRAGTTSSPGLLAAGRPGAARRARCSRASTSRLRDRHPHARHQLRDEPARGARARPRRRRPAVHHDRLFAAGDGRGRGARRGASRRLHDGGPAPAPRGRVVGRRSPTRSGAARRTRAAWRSARPASTGSATGRRGTRSWRAFRGAARDRPRAGRCRSSSTAATPTTTASTLLDDRGAADRRCCTASPRPSASTRRSSAAGTAPSPATSPTAAPPTWQDAARRVPAELLLLETDAPYLAPVPHRGRPNEPAYVMDTLRVRRRPARRGAGTPRRAASRRTPPARSAWRDARPGRSRWRVSPSSGSRPTRGSGSTSSSTTTSSASRCGSPSLQPDDVVLEVGPGLGVLTAALADAVASRARDRARPAPRAGAGDHTRRPHQRHGALRRRARRRPGVARPRADGVRLEPPVQRRDAADRRLARRPAHRRAVGGDDPARARRPPLRGARHRELRRAVRARPAGVRPHRQPPRITHRLRAAAERRLRPARLPPQRALAGARSTLGAAQRALDPRRLRHAPEDPRERHRHRRPVPAQPDRAGARGRSAPTRASVRRPCHRRASSRSTSCCRRRLCARAAPGSSNCTERVVQVHGTASANCTDRRRAIAPPNPAPFPSDGRRPRASPRQDQPRPPRRAAARPTATTRSCR